jgi:hypothetical protein
MVDFGYTTRTGKPAKTPAGVQILARDVKQLEMQGITRDEAVCRLLEKAGYDSETGKKIITETPKTKTAKAEKPKTKRVSKPRTLDKEKVEILDTILQAMTAAGFETTVLKPAKMLEVVKDGATYTIDLVKKRTPKDGDDMKKA